jgi:peroxiredoxin Q/BCP
MSETGIEVGKKAPAFRLINQDDQPVSLKDLSGRWVVLYFYPKDDTPGCTTEACEFTSGLKQFEELDALVIGVSADSPESHRKFIQKHGLKVLLLSDPDHAVMEQYGAWGPKLTYGKETIGVIRSTVLIDPQGKIAHHWPKVKAEGHAEQVREKLELFSQ